MRGFLDNRNALGLAFMLPAAALLLVFLTYPLGLGLWLGFTDARIGRVGQWIGIENFVSLFGDSLARLSLFNTLFYTVIASVVKFALGLWLALLLNRHLPVQGLHPRDRAVALHRADRALGDRLLVDLRRAVLGGVVGAREDGDHRHLHRFPRRALDGALLDHRRQHLARRALRRDLPARGAADDLAHALRGGGPGRRDRVAKVPARDAADAHTDHRRGDDVLGAVHLTDFQLIYVLTRAGP